MKRLFTIATTTALSAYVAWVNDLDVETVCYITASLGVFYVYAYPLGVKGFAPALMFASIKADIVEIWTRKR